MTFRKTTTIVEALKDKSVFVPEPPTGTIYKYVDIWVGDKGAGLPTSLRNGFVGFKVEKTWIKNNNANESMINLQRYDQGWQPFYTEKVGEDDNYIYYRAVAPGFSCFAITEYSGPKENIKAISIAETLQKALIDLSGNRNKITIGSEKNGRSKIIDDPMGMARILMAIALPMFLGIVGYCIFKKKI
jgi:PGF-pre-PGF domain-containing protein